MYQTSKENVQYVVWIINHTSIERVCDLAVSERNARTTRYGATVVCCHRFEWQSGALPVLVLVLFNLQGRRHKRGQSIIPTCLLVHQTKTFRFQKGVETDPAGR